MVEVIFDSLKEKIIEIKCHRNTEKPPIMPKTEWRGKMRYIEVGEANEMCQKCEAFLSTKSAFFLSEQDKILSVIYFICTHSKF